MSSKDTHKKVAEIIVWGVQWLGSLRQSLDIVEGQGAEAVHEAFQTLLAPILAEPGDLGGHLALCLLAGEATERSQRHEGDLSLAYAMEAIVLGVVVADIVSVEERQFWAEAACEAFEVLAA